MPISLQTVFPEYALDAIAFNTALKFDHPTTIYAQHTVAGAIAFTANTTGAVDGYSAIVRLVANGTNTPTFSSAFKQLSGSAGYSNINGTLNIIQVTKLGSDYWYTVAQEYTPPPVIIPELPELLSASGAGTSLITLTYDSTLNPLSTPANNAFTLSSGSVVGVSIVGQEVRLTTAAATPSSGLTISYVSPNLNPLQDDAGLPVPNITNQAVTGGAVPQFLPFSVRSANIIVGSVPNTYEISGTPATAQFMLGDLKIPAGQDGWVSFDHVSNDTGRNMLLGFDDENTNKRSNVEGAGWNYGAYINGVSALLPITDGVNGAATGRTIAEGEKVRLRRSSGAILLEVNNAGATWEIIYTWPGTFTADIFINQQFGNATVFNNPQIFGGVAK